MNIYPQFRQITDLPLTFLRNDDTFKQLMAAFAAALTLGTYGNRQLLKNTIYQQADGGWLDVWGDLPGIPRHFQESDELYQPRLPNMLLAPRDSAVAIELWLQNIELVIGTVSETLPNWGYTVNLPATLTASQVQQIINDLAYVRPAGMPFTIKNTTGGTYLNEVNYFGPILSRSASGQVQTVQSPWNFGGRVTGSFFVASGAVATTYLGTVNYYGSSKYFIQRLIPPTLAQPWNFGGRVTGAWFASIDTYSGVSIPSATNNQISLLPDLLMVDPTLNQG